MVEKKPDLEWNELSEIESEIKYRIENKSDFYDGEPEPTDDEIRTEIENNCDIINHAYDDFLYFFQELINKIASKYTEEFYWVAEVQGFGWRGQSGGLDVFYETDARKLLGKILPNCDCTYKIFMNRTGFELQNFHHDSPTGNEWYTIRHITLKEFMKSEFY
jgi:hypothetical protein